MQFTIFTNVPQDTSKGKTGLMIGHRDETVGKVFAFAYTPGIDVDLSLGLLELLDTRIGERGRFKDWVVEHANQVAKMLPGGIEIIGFFAQDISFSLTPGVIGLVKSINNVSLNKESLLVANFEEETKCCEVNFMSGKTRNIEWKIGCAEPLVEIDSKICVYIEKRPNEDFDGAISRWREAIGSSRVLLEGDNGKLTAKLYLKGIGVLEEQSVGLLRGIVHCKAFANEGESIEVISKIVKDDVVGTLKRRMELHRNLQGNREYKQMLRRVFLYHELGFAVCDYLDEGERIEHSIARVRNMLGFEAVKTESVETLGNTREKNRNAARKSAIWVLIPLILALVVSLIIKYFL